MRNLLLLGFCIALTGCAKTDMTGFVDPQYKNYHVSHVVVRVKGANLDNTLNAEQEFANQLTARQVKVTKFSDIIPPTRSYSPSQETALLRKTGADSLLTVEITGKDTTETYIPPTFHPGQSTTQINQIGSMAYATTYTSPGFTTGGYVVSSSVLNTLSTLVDLKNGRQIWRGEGSSSGDEISSISLLLSAGEAAINDLGAKSILPNVK
jgi:hypothetical protein